MIACPICGSRTAVVETRASGASARRRRHCTKADCAGKVTTVEVIVQDGRASALTKGNVVVSRREIEQLKKIVDAIGGGEL